MNIVKINKDADNCGENVQLRINEAIEYAKCNPVDNVVIVMTGSDGSVMDCWANRGDPYTMVGAIEAIKMEFMAACIEGRE